jgi:hypothetical protein
VARSARRLCRGPRIRRAAGAFSSRVSGGSVCRDSGRDCIEQPLVRGRDRVRRFRLGEEIGEPAWTRSAVPARPNPPDVATRVDLPDIQENTEELVAASAGPRESARW